MFLCCRTSIWSLCRWISLNDPWMKDFRPAEHRPFCMTTILLQIRIWHMSESTTTKAWNSPSPILKKLGHKKIGYLSSALGSHIMQVRHKAFFHALKQNGLKSDPTCAGSSYYITQCMEKHLPRLLDMGITGIICSYDLIANAAMIQCQQLGYKVPDEISIIGFDDLPICTYTSPPLTTIRQERIQLGKSAYYALDSLMNQVSIGTLLLHAKLIERGSTGEVLSDK